MSSGGGGGGGFSTRAVHAGQPPDPSTGAVVPNIVLASTFAQRSPGVPHGGPHGFEYARTNNPTRAALEACVSDLSQGADFSVAFASGMAAITACLHLLRPGDRVAAIADAYGGTLRVLNSIAGPTYGIAADYCEFAFRRRRREEGGDPVGIHNTVAETHAEAVKRIAAVLRALPRRDATRMVWLESPSNPLLNIVDIAAVAEAIRVVFPSEGGGGDAAAAGSSSAHTNTAVAAAAAARRVLLVVDNTFMSPYFQSPLALGADLCVEASTKFLNGHSDVVGGIVSGRGAAGGDGAASLEARLRHIQNAAGAVPSPFDCYLCLRGIKTLAIRMERCARNAMAVAVFLEQHASVDKVLYPGLVSHPHHALARRQASGFGSMITFYLKGDFEAARLFLESVRLFTLAESLGAVESLIESPAIMTHASIPKAKRLELGLADNLVRLSIGVEDEADLIADLAQALGTIP